MVLLNARGAVAPVSHAKTRFSYSWWIGDGNQPPGPITRVLRNIACFSLEIFVEQIIGEIMIQVEKQSGCWIAAWLFNVVTVSY